MESWIPSSGPTSCQESPGSTGEAGNAPPHDAVMMPDSTNDLIRRRHAKLLALRDRGIDPFGSRYPVTHWVRDFDGLRARATEEELRNFGTVIVAGRIMTLRHHGKTCFAHLSDYTGQIQLYARADQLADDYALFTDLDTGDFIGVTGELFRTRTGELTVAVKAFAFLTKSLHPLPEKWHGLKDVEIRYRKRELDLIANEPVREVFRQRSRLLASLRRSPTAHREAETAKAHRG